MSVPQIIRTDAGDELVVLTRRDYDSLLARAGDADAEDAMTRRIVAESNAAIEAGDDIVMPDTLWRAMEANDVGQPPLRQLRDWRQMTLPQLAKATGLDEQHLSALEDGTQSGSPETLKALARVFRVPLALVERA